MLDDRGQMKAEKTIKPIEPIAEYMTWKLVECSYHSPEEGGWVVSLHVWISCLAPQITLTGQTVAVADEKGRFFTQQ